MPNYISHAIMGEEVYKTAIKKESLFKIYVPKEMMRSYSLGADLAVFSKKTIVDPHDFYTKAFFLTMIQYIKNNNLIENNQVMVARRDNFEKSAMSMDNLIEEIVKLLDVVQKDMFTKSKANRDKRVVEADSLEGILAGVENKNFVKAGWCGCRECEDKVKEFASATARVMCDEEGVPETCAICGKKAKHKVIFARAY